MATKSYQLLLQCMSDINSSDSSMWLLLQLYELGSEPERKEFLDDLFTFMQKRGEWVNVFWWFHLKSA